MLEIRVFQGIEQRSAEPVAETADPERDLANAKARVDVLAQEIWALGIRDAFISIYHKDRPGTKALASYEVCHYGAEEYVPPSKRLEWMAHRG